MRIKIREFPGKPPYVVEIDSTWTVGEVERKLSAKLGKNPRTTRLVHEGRPLPRNRSFIELSKDIDFENAVLDMVPEHRVGLSCRCLLFLPH